jgi:DNA primase
MTSGIDFTELKQNVSIERACELLGIRLKKTGAQLRGPCPICKDGGDRAFVVTPAKGLYYCFGKCRKGGDAITLAAQVQNCTLREAAEFLASKAGLSPGGQRGDNSSHDSPQPQPREKRQGFDPEAYVKTLDPAHEALAPLGIDPQTYRQWKAGYAGSGVNRGRLALPVTTKDGTIIGFIGRTLKDESPTLTFPNGLAPQEYIFGIDRVAAGALTLVRDPIDVLRAFEAGCENVVCFLTEEVTAQQLEGLASLMDERKCETVAFF